MSCELGVTNDLGEQADLRRGRGLFACVFLATVDIVQLTWLGLLFCVFTTEHCVVVIPLWDRCPPAPAICKALFVTLLMRSSLPPWEGWRVPLKVQDLGLIEVTTLNSGPLLLVKTRLSGFNLPCAFIWNGGAGETLGDLQAESGLLTSAACRLLDLHSCLQMTDQFVF